LQIGKCAADINGDANGARGGFGAQGFDPSRIRSAHDAWQPKRQTGEYHQKRYGQKIDG
jgi:hypothetical protein